MEIFFYLFAGLMVVSSCSVVTSKNPVYSVLWLIFTFCNGSGLMILLGAEFLAMMLVVIYVGAVAVLFLFVIMMLNIRFTDIIVQFKKNLFISIAVALIMFADLVLIIYLGTKEIALDNSQFAIGSDISLPAKYSNRPLAKLAYAQGFEGDASPRTAAYSSVREDSSTASLSKLPAEVEFCKRSNAHAIGQVLYTDYILPFQISGIILFMAMISCIGLTIRHRSDVKRQDIAKQHGKNKDNCILMVKPRLNAGIGEIQYD
ncbi:MAG: NADH-quinone oxidoreductase subunit J [Rickettsia endosymbiont of Labidopullus appendiculatus]|nr:NADH-quinone oxidoreductase subunit J [Rickettsia endosymbiont of Labidopullus appendiculatus]